MREDGGTRVPSVACVVVNWNGFADTDACLRSLAGDGYDRLQVVVVDNGSTDGSLERLQARHAGVKFVANGVNAGFAEACNVGARAAGEVEFLWLLNNDTLVEEGTTEKLVAAAERDARVGVVGAVLYRMDAPDVVQAWGGGRVSRWSGYNTHFTGPAELGADCYITFACALIRRECFAQLGGVYAGAFMYFEDADFCLRAYAAGWRLGVAEKTRVLHREGGSGDAGKVRRVTAAGLGFLGRHGQVRWISYSVFLTLRLGRRVLRRDWAGVRAVWAGAGDWWRGTSVKG